MGSLRNNGVRDALTHVRWRMNARTEKLNSVRRAALAQMIKR